MKYEELSIKEKSLLLDKYVKHAKAIKDNFFVITNPDNNDVKIAILSAEHFLKTLDKELENSKLGGEMK